MRPEIVTPRYRALGPEGFGTYEVEWSATGPKMTRVSRSADVLLVPGFVDLHVHGGFGIDFMSASSGDMEVLCSKLEAKGYEAFLATTVAASAEAVLAAVANLPEHPMIAGFHLEGPFLSEKYPGAQPRSEIRLPPAGGSEWDAVLDHSRLRVVTMAPELPGALELTTRLMKRGVKVSMGHTNATYEEARRGFEFGAAHCTHTFNAMRGLHHREAGMVGYALLNDALKAELIYDRLHVGREAARLLFKCKGADGVIAVSDGTQAIGMPPGTRIEMWGERCVMGRGEVRLEEGGALAGSAITLLDAFRNLAEDFGEETAVRCCCVNPREALGMGAPRVWLELGPGHEIMRRISVRG